MSSANSLFSAFGKTFMSCTPFPKSSKAGLGLATDLTALLGGKRQILKFQCAASIPHVPVVPCEYSSVDDA